ncbi:MAG: GNAT family N-acetyltransferase [Clostridia bacterium]|nr:GNAT family N-acetyltransferase [Clostridia bacterium]
MIFSPKTIPLKDGRTAVLRSPDPERDAAELVQYLYDTAADTPFVLREPDEVSMTVEGEERFLDAIVDSDTDCMILCEVDGRIAGNCHLSFRTKKKVRHRCEVAIALRKEYWNLGIGTAMFGAMIGAAEEREGVTVMELEFIEGNARARALYEKMGFRIVGWHPDAIRQKDGTLLALYLMQRPV